MRTESYGLLEAYGDCAKAVDVDEATTASPDEGSEVARASEVDTTSTRGGSQTCPVTSESVGASDRGILEAGARA